MNKDSPREIAQHELKTVGPFIFHIMTDDDPWHPNLFYCSGKRTWMKIPEGWEGPYYASLIGCTDEAIEEADIPGWIEWEGKQIPVFHISSGEFAKCRTLRSVLIPSPVVSLDFWCFTNHIHLEKAILPPTLQEIGAEAFCCCQSLKSVLIPSSVRSIGQWAFAGCTSLSISCEAPSRPEGWDLDWNYDDFGTVPALWGVKRG